MAQRIAVGDMANAISEALEEYAGLATEDMKKAVKRAGRKVRKEIKETAPRDDGEYADSWRVKTVKENAGRYYLCRRHSLHLRP